MLPQDGSEPISADRLAERGISMELANAVQQTRIANLVLLTQLLEIALTEVNKIATPQPPKQSDGRLDANGR